MPNDVPDYTSAVQVTAGSISITGTPTVLVSGTVAVSITGANTVILGAGSNTIGSISAIGSTVTVAGTVNIGGTPAVTISGTPTVNIGAGSVSITGTANINIQGQSITVNTNQPQSLVLDADVAGPVTSNSSFTTVLPPGTHAVEVYFSAGTVPLSRIDSWNLQGGATANFYRNFTSAPDTLAYPIRISGLIENNGLKVNTHFTPPLAGGETVHIKVVAILDSAVPTLTDQSSYAHLDPVRDDPVDRAARLAGIVATDSSGLVDAASERVLGAVQVRAASLFVGPFQNKGHRGLVVALDVTAVGTGNLQFALQLNIPSLGTNLTLISDTTLIVTGVGLVYFLVYPTAVGPVASLGQLKAAYDMVLPDNWIVGFVKSDASNWTYGASAFLLV